MVQVFCTSTTTGYFVLIYFLDTNISFSNTELASFSKIIYFISFYLFRPFVHFPKWFSWSIFCFVIVVFNDFILHFYEWNNWPEKIITQKVLTLWYQMNHTVILKVSFTFNFNLPVQDLQGIIPLTNVVWATLCVTLSPPVNLEDPPDFLAIKMQLLFNDPLFFLQCPRTMSY